MLTLAKISRLIGVDQLHIGTAGIGKMHGSASEELSIEAEIEEQKIKANPKTNRLEQNWYGMKLVLAVASGGVSPLQIPKIVKTMGNNIIIQAGGGVHGHPDGTESGAKAMRQSIEATMKKIPLKKYSKTHKELEQAFDKWDS